MIDVTSLRLSIIGLRAALCSDFPDMAYAFDMVLLLIDAMEVPKDGQY